MSLFTQFFMFCVFRATRDQQTAESDLSAVRRERAELVETLES